MAKTYDIVIDGKTCSAEYGEYLWDVCEAQRHRDSRAVPQRGVPRVPRKLPRMHCGSGRAWPLQGGHFLRVPHRRGMRGAH